MLGILVTAVFLALSPLVQAQEAPAAPDASKTPPATKLEAFSARTGIVLIKGFSRIGALSGSGGTVTVEVREFRDASNPKSAQYGVTFEVKESGRLERENTSFIDEDEIDSLIRGLEYISKVKGNSTPLGNFEAQYRTKGDLSLTVFSAYAGDIQFAVSSGRIGRTSAYLPLRETEKLHAILTEAKTVIASAKLGVR